MKIIILLAVVVSFALASVAFSQPVATSAVSAASAIVSVTTSVTPEGCIIEKFVVPSPSMKRQIRALVVLPPEYKDHPDKRYPILFALQSGYAPYHCWSKMPQLRRALQQRPMIVASFDVDPLGWYLDSPVKPDSKFATFLFDEFLPYLDAHYRTNGQRGVTGISMGGFGAMHYMLSRPELFTSVSAISSDFFRLNEKATRGDYGLVVLLGDPKQHPEEYAKIDITSRIATAVKNHVKLPSMMLYCTTEDYYGLLPENRELAKFLVEQNHLIATEAAKEAAAQPDQASRDKLAADLLAARRINYISMETPGQHDWPFWREASELVIDFHWRSFRDAAQPTGKP